MMQPSHADFLGIFGCLAQHQVEFLVVGGVSAVLQGAPIVTMDLDIVHRRTAENISRLLRALEQLKAVYREKPERSPNQAALSTKGHQLLLTKLGPLDVLGVIGGKFGYEDLLEHTEELALEQLQLKILNLPKLIEVKQLVGREKDKLMLPILRHTLRERS